MTTSPAADQAPIAAGPPTGAALPTGAAKVRAVDGMFDRIAPRYDLVNRVMTFGLDVGWRRRTVRELRLAPGSVVLDLACGTGDLCRTLAKAGHHAIGIDRSAGMLAAARTTAPLVRGDACDLGVRSGSVDGVVSGFALRNFVALPPFLAELSRVVRPRGRIALLDVDEPSQALLRAGHAVYFRRVVPVVGGILSDGSAYRYLPRSVAYLPPADELLAMIEAAGFTAVRKHRLSGGIAQLLTAVRR